MLNCAVPLLVSRMVCAALVDPTACELNVRLVGERVIAGVVADSPVPLNSNPCGLPMALSAMETEAVRIPAAVGVKVTLMMQLSPGSTEEPQVLVWLKSPEWVPTIVISLTFKAAVPLLVSTTACAALAEPTACEANVRLVGERVIAGAVAAAPVPVSGRLCGLPAASSTIETEATRAPGMVGVNITLTAQLDPERRLEPQVLVSLKSALLAPVMSMPIM